VTIEVRRAADRFVARAEGRTTWHSFSFGGHYDPANVGFGALVAHNDEHLPPGTGYSDHPHHDVEIVTLVLEGALRHTDSTGRSGVLERPRGPGPDRPARPALRRARWRRARALPPRHERASLALEIVTSMLRA
jgi:hypothetical protein